MTSRFFSALLFMISIGFAQDGFAKNVSVSGSTTVANIIMLPQQSKIEEDAGVTLDILPNGSGFGIMDLIAGRSDLAMISAPLETTLAKINEKQPESVDGHDLQSHQIGETSVVFIVHPDNPLTFITLQQIKDIIGGKISNWQQLGGPDLPIVIVAETYGGGIRSLVEEQLNDGQSLGENVLEFTNATQVPVVTSQLPTALGIASQTRSTHTASRAIDTDEAISQPLILVTRGQPSTEIQAIVNAARTATH